VKITREQVVEKLLLVVAFSAITSLLLIAVFIVKEGAPFLFKVGLRDFLWSSDWRPQAGHFGIYPMVVASLWVTFGALLVGGPLGIGGDPRHHDFADRNEHRRRRDRVGAAELP
jgi:ABC-type phosphate transport system permease subunit